MSILDSKIKSFYEYWRFTVLNFSWLKIYIYKKNNPWTLNLCIFHFPSVWRVSFNLFLVMNLQNKERENMQCEAIFFLLRPPRSKKGWWEVTDCVGVGWAGQGGVGVPWGTSVIGTDSVTFARIKDKDKRKLGSHQLLAKSHSLAHKDTMNCKGQ